MLPAACQSASDRRKWTPFACQRKHEDWQREAIGMTNQGFMKQNGIMCLWACLHLSSRMTCTPFVVSKNRPTGPCVEQAQDLGLTPEVLYEEAEERVDDESCFGTCAYHSTIRAAPRTFVTLCRETVRSEARHPARTTHRARCRSKAHWTCSASP